MANRYYTFMLIPERSSRVKKWLVPSNAIRWVVGGTALLLIVGFATTFFTLRYFVRYGEFQQARLQNQYLEGEIQKLQNKLSASDSSMVRIQNFEQKLRGLASLDTESPAGGIGPIDGDENASLIGQDVGEGTMLASLQPGIAPETAYRMRSLEISIEDLHRKASLQEQSLQETYELLKDQKTMLASKPSIWPTNGWVTSQFGYRTSPFTGLRQLHAGLDIASKLGTKILAPADAVVTFSSTERSYGKVVVLNHGYDIVTRYGHCSELLVKVGQKVKRGDAIALVGSTGRSTASHLHYEVRVNGIPVNPARYILN